MAFQRVIHKPQRSHMEGRFRPFRPTAHAPAHIRARGCRRARPRADPACAARATPAACAAARARVPMGRRWKTLRKTLKDVCKLPTSFGRRLIS